MINLPELNETLKSLIKYLQEIDRKLDIIIRQNERILSSQGSCKSNSLIVDEKFRVVPDALTLLSLPSSLRKTILAIYKLGEATAEDISRETNRLRAVESDHANALVRLGLVKKRRKGRKVYFYIE